MDSIKINKLEIENVKRIKAVKIEPSRDGLTIVGGNNNQGKTSVLDSIAWALGGEKYRPSQATRDGSAIPPNLRIIMSNGLIVERKGKNSSLKVTDPNGNKSGQQLLNEFVEQLALNLPKFMESSGKEKAQTLLRIIGVGEQLEDLEKKEKELFSHRHAIGQIADQKKKFAEEQTYYPDAPKELVSPSELIRKQQEILARNGENQRKRDRLNEITANKHRIFDNLNQLDDQIADLQARKDQLKREYDQVASDEAIARKTVLELQDESTKELEASIADIDEINRKVRANLDKDKAEDDAQQYKNQYASLTEQIENTRQAKTDLLKTADLPLLELSVKEGELVYRGQQWDNMSGSDRLKVSTAIVRKLNPKCGFVLLDKLEQMDIQTLNEFGQWLEQEGLQAIATRVSTGDECSIIIEDGYIKGQVPLEENTQEEPGKTAWKVGEF